MSGRAEVVDKAGMKSRWPTTRPFSCKELMRDMERWLSHNVAMLGSGVAAAKATGLAR